MRLFKQKKRDLKARRSRDPRALQESVLCIRHFWGAQQHFFRQLLLCAKVDETVALARAAMLRGESVVICMWSTGESITQARDQQTKVVKIEPGREVGADLDFASAPKEIARRYMEKQLQTMLQEVQSPDTKAEFERLKKQLEGLDLPLNPLDALINALGGPPAVAELTGRSKRLVDRGTSGARYEERGEGTNIQEQLAFQSGKKHVVIITEAASAGISLHADRRLPEAAQRPRYLISMELPWEADKAIQQLGRVHRSNQVAPPKFAFVVTDLGGEVRFMSAIARRLRILGAMMRGDRNSAHGAVDALATFDIQNRYGRRALNQFYELLRTKATPEVDFTFIHPSGQGTSGSTWNSWEQFVTDADHALAQIGLRPDSDDKFDESLDESRSINVFLNRLLMLPPALQNGLFDAVAELYAHLVDAGRKDGSFDKGLEKIGNQGRQRASISMDSIEVLHTDPHTGAATTHVVLKVDHGMSWEVAKDMSEEDCEHRAEGFYWMKQKPGQRSVVLAVRRPSTAGQHRAGADETGYMYDDDDEVQFDIYTPFGMTTADSAAVDRDTLSSPPYSKVTHMELAEAGRVWVATFGASDRWVEEHIISGSVLNTWSALGAVTATQRGGQHRPRIPLVRAQLQDGTAVVGVRVRPERLSQVRYALSALQQQQEPCRHEVDVEGQASAAAKPTGSFPGVEALSERLELILQKAPERRALWNGWPGAHHALMSEGVLDASPKAMELAEQAVIHLDRNGKLDMDADSGIVQLREKQKGCGWYIPPPKKPKKTATRSSRAKS